VSQELEEGTKPTGGGLVSGEEERTLVKLVVDTTEKYTNLTE